MISTNLFLLHNAQVDLSYLLRFFAKHLEKYFLWVSCQSREKLADANLRRDAGLIFIGTCIAAFAILVFLIQNDLALAIACLTTWGGSIFHLARGRLCTKVAKLLKFSTPIISSLPIQLVALPHQNFSSFDITPPKKPPRLTSR